MVALTVLVAIVVTAVLATTAGARRSQTAFDRYLNEVRPFDAVVLAGEHQIDPALLADIEGVHAAVGFRLFLILPEADREGGFYPIGVPDDPRIPKDYLRYPLVAGRYPDPREPLEVALGERTAQRLGAGVGSLVPMVSYTEADAQTGDFENPHGPAFDLLVVGIHRDPGDIAGLEDDLTVTILTPAFGARYDGEIALFGTGAALSFEPQASIEHIAAEVESLGSPSFDVSLGQESLRAQADPTFDAIATGLHLVALVGGLLGLATIVRTVAGAATLRARDVDSLSALGAGRWTLHAQLGLSSAGAGLFGVALGALLSVGMSWFFPVGLARSAELHPAVRVDGAVLVWGIVLAAVVLTVCVIATSALVLRRERRGARRAPRPSTVAAAAARWGAPLTVVTGLRFAFDPGQGERATPVRAAAGATALGAAGMVATIVFGASLHHAVLSPSVYGWGWDAVLSGGRFIHLSDGMVDEARLAADESFAAVAEIVEDLEVTVDGEPVRATVLEDKRGHTSFVMVRGREPRGSDEVALGGGTLEQLGMGVGDTVSVSAGGQARPMRVVGVAALPVRVDGGSSSSGLAMDRAAADAIGFNGNCDGDVACARSYAVTAVAGTDVADALQAHTVPGVVQVDLPAPPSEVEPLTAAQDIPLILASVLGINAILSIAHAASATVRLRRRDMAVLRAMGFSSAQLRRLVSVQVVALSILGATVGAAVGVVVGAQVWALVTRRLFLPNVTSISLVALLGVPVGIVAVAHLATTLSRRAAGRVPIAVALRAE